jgi:hypothetical protein
MLVPTRLIHFKIKREKAQVHEKLRHVSPMPFMQPLNFQHIISKRSTTTNSVPSAHRQRVQAAIVDDSLHPSKYLSLCQKLKTPEFESQD